MFQRRHCRTDWLWTDLPLTFQFCPRPEDRREGGHQEALSALPVTHPRQAGLQGTQATATHTARERKPPPPPFYSGAEIEKNT